MNSNPSTLTESLAQTVQSNGPIRFDTFMQRALYDPRWGYYSSGDRIFGAEGDFVTAPELTPLFGQTLAAALRPLINQGLDQFHEFGAGRGKLAAQLLGELGHSLARYTIVELSGELMRSQQAFLKAELPSEIYSKVHWAQRLPETLEGLVLGNELLDAVPVRRFRWTPEQTQEAYVATDESGMLALAWLSAAPDMVNYVAAQEKLHGPWPAPFESEWAEQALALTRTLTERLQGVCVMIDYGMSASQYYQASHNQGHLRAHARHLAHDDFLMNPGQQDLTAHVNFSAVYEAIEPLGGRLEGYCSQGNFLLHHGLLDLAGKTPILTDPAKGGALRQAIHTLTSEAAMGLSFKVMAWSRDFEPADCELLSGFQRFDLSHQL